ncbi:hypothetical protein [Pedobacter sp. UBA4863]|uniref:hypothetical protein n=1 Tax=Pedobacter sp. UBA4863 TaxID=1947060 RepID=UPI0025CCFAC3|nr:hypothetical protein [Pedobacter sp. UBA4863]
MKAFKLYQSLAFLVIANAIFFTSCKKDNSNPEKTQDQGKLAFFLDTFRVYSSDLEGKGLKTVVDEDEKSGNNYIARIIYTNSNKFVYGYKPANGSFQIKVANADGSNKKTLKTLTGNAGLSFLGSFGDKIMYTTLDYSGTTPIMEIRTMSEDGSNDVKLNLPRPTLTARGGSTFVSTTEDNSTATPSSTSYVVKFKNDVWDEASSFSLPKVTGLIRASAISDDGNTLVYVLAADYSTLTYDVFTMDISKKGNTAKKVLSHTFPTTGEGAVQFPPQISIALAGAANVLVGYGVDVDKKRYATKNDYYYIQNIDLDKGIISKKWKIAGEYGGSLLAN